MAARRLHGLPFNEAGWRKGYSWDEAAGPFPRQCFHTSQPTLARAGDHSFQKVIDPVTGQLQAYSLHGSYGRPRTIWMDGRPHPSELAPHTWGGFSTGAWERHTLVVSTTHIKTGWLQRNGAPTSDLATMREHFTRYGDYLMVVTFINDPVFLAGRSYEAPTLSLACPRMRMPGAIAGRRRSSTNSEGARRGRCRTTCRTRPTTSRSFWLTAEFRPREPEAAPTRYIRSLPQSCNGAPSSSIRETARLGSGFVISRRAARIRNRAIDQVRSCRFNANVYRLAGAGGNMAVQVGEDGVLLVDWFGHGYDKVIAAIRQLSDKPIRFILNTHAHPDHMGGNEVLAKAGSARAGGRPADSPGPGALVLAHEAVLFAVGKPSGRQPAMPVGAWPTEGYPGESKEVFSNGEAIQLIHPSSAGHTDGDSVVFFRRSDVVVTGDLFVTTSYPVFDVDRGGSLNGVIASLNRIIDITIPKDWQEGGTMVIPGHGRIGDEADVVEYRDMMTIIRDRIQYLIKKGMTLEQVKAAGPTFEYDGRYGATTGTWTTDMFVEAAYKDLSRR